MSSSGHLVLLPALLGWSYAELDDELRKSFEVALHAGTAAALVLVLRDEVRKELRRGRLARHALTLLPAAVGGLALERIVEERLGSARGAALAQIVAGTVLGLADRAPAVRRFRSAGVLDALVVGTAQAVALAPGVSRNGATLTAARLLRFSRPAANRLSRQAALPVIVAAAGLKGVRLARRGLPVELRAPFAVGAASAFASTLVARPLIAAVDGARSYGPFAVYRAALGAASLLALPVRR